MARAWIIVTGGVAALGAAGAIGLGPGAPLLVDWLADGRAFGRLGLIEVDGVSGAHLGDLRAQTVRLRDSEGVYATAHDVRLVWSPFDLFGSAITVQTAAARSLSVVRAPQLAPQTEINDARLDIDLKALRIDAVRWTPAADGAPVEASLDAALTMRRGVVRSAALHVESGSDTLAVDYGRSTPQRLTGRLFAPADGAVSRWLGLSEPLQIDVEGQGDAANFKGAMRARLADRPLLEGAFSQAAGEVRIDGDVDLRGHRVARDIAQSLGERARIAMTADAQSAQATFSSPGLSARINGPALARWLDGPLTVSLAAPSASALAPGLAARVGAMRVDGVAAASPTGWTLTGEAALESVQAGAVRVAAAGPFTAGLEAQRAQIIWSASVSGLDSASRRQIGDGRARIEAGWRRADGVLDSVMLSAEGALGALSLQGDAERVSGRWRINALSALASDWRGEAAGDVALARDRVTVSGVGAGVAAPGALRTIVGAAPRLSASGRWAKAGLVLDAARVEGANGRLGLRGHLGDVLDLDVEAVVRGPVTLGAAVVDGEMIARGTMTGAVATPQIAMSALADEAETPVGVLRGVRVDWRGEGRAGVLDVSALSEHGPVRMSAPITFDDNGWRAPAVNAQVMGVAANGAVASQSGAVTIEAAFANEDAAKPHVSGRATWVDQRLEVQAEIAGAHVLGVSDAHVAVDMSGPLDAVAVRAQARGTAGREAVNVGVDGVVSMREASVEARLDARGDVGGAPFSTTTPVVAIVDGEGWRAEMDAAVADGVVQARVRQAGGAVSATAQVRDAPLTPILAVFGEQGGGRLSGAVEITAQGDSIDATMDIQAIGLQLERRAPDPLDVAMQASVTDGDAHARVSVASASGLRADATFDGPVVFSTRGLALRPDRDARVDWRIAGAAEPLWAAFGPLDQRLSGRIDGQGRFDVSAVSVRGSGQARISGAALIDSATGLRLRDLSASVLFDESGAVIESITAQGENGGRVSGAGPAFGPDGGALTLSLDRLRVLDRADITATASGPLTVSWGAGAPMTARGALTLDEVNASPPRPARARVLLPVREVNRPAGLDAAAVASVEHPLVFDVTMSAPSRVFVRGRGLQSEWSVDLAVRGDSADPQLFGQARLLRGDFLLAGRAFALNRGLVRFVGPIEDAALDVVAERATPDLTAEMRLSGTLSAPQFAALSTPALPQEEVLPRILFGRGVADLTPFEAAEMANGLAALAGENAFDVAGAARALVQLDRLDVRSLEGGFSVTGGKYLSPDVYLELARTSLGGAQAALEWQVRPRLFLVSRFNPQGDARVSIRWRGDGH